MQAVKNMCANTKNYSKLLEKCKWFFLAGGDGSWGLREGESRKIEPGCGDPVTMFARNNVSENYLKITLVGADPMV